MRYINEENDGEFVDVDAIVNQIDYETDDGSDDLETQPEDLY